MDRISLLAFDMDGTLLDASTDISPRTLQAVKRAMEQGVRVTLASGRALSSMRMYADRIGIDGPLIAANGAVVMHSRTGEVLYDAPIPRAVLSELVARLAQAGLYYTLLSAESYSFTRGDPRLALSERYNTLAAAYGAAPAVFRFLEPGGIDVGEGEPVYKVVTHIADPALSAELTAFAAGTGVFQVTLSSPGLHEFLVKEASKGTGLAVAARYYGIPMAETVAFGDYNNDIDLFKAAGLGIAMGNAVPELLPYAGRQTASNTEDGIALALDELLGV